MWPFGFGNRYPYTDFHELNLDWILGKITELDQAVKNWMKNITPTIRDAVNQWLDDHPEATTTVEDGAITIEKLNSSLLGDPLTTAHMDPDGTDIIWTGDYITPQMFGAVADGVTDDTAAFQNALDALSENDELFVPKGTYKITSSLNINTPNVTIFGSPINEYYGKILIPSSVVNAININRAGVTISNIAVEEATTAGLATGVYIQRTDGLSDDENANLDANIKDCHFLNLHTCIETNGRNVNIFDCLLSGSRIGIKVNDATTAVIRGIEIYRNRFHGIGSNHNYASDCCCIQMPAAANPSTQQIFNIKNNFADYSNTFIKGSLCGCNITDNTIYGGYTSFIDGFGGGFNHHFKPTIIDSNNFESAIQTSAAMPGRVMKGIIVDYSWQIKVSNNELTNTSQNPIELSRCTGAVIQNNKFTRSPQMPVPSGYTSAYPYIKLDYCENAIIDGNSLADDNSINANYAYSINNTNYIYMGKNHLKANTGEHENAVPNIKPYGYYNIPFFGTYVANKVTSGRTDPVCTIDLPAAGTYMIGVMFECTARPIVVADAMTTDGNNYNSFASGSMVPCTVTQPTTVTFMSGTNASQTYYYARAYAIKIA